MKTAGSERNSCGNAVDTAPISHSHAEKDLNRNGNVNLIVNKTPH